MASAKIGARRPLGSVVMRSVLVVGIGTVSSAVSIAQTDQYPSRTVRMVVPFAAGGPTDIAARLVASHLSKAWEQPVVVEARPGGGSVVGTAAVAQAEPDGLYGSIWTELSAR